ncbi:hypothetical protein ZYGR_0E01690 [Zygosaccharomyces rouxii]|uniref:ZYRO0B03740p n=2 Tax=Zygosaccharomyces rouxii TaxID=4956 RepID=C5DQX4_ZYGRC|nr:uncharacterized protein ZYRO0B03740g [Zygosaccharomyces rouxii]KAH9200266.1 hypothetical protein LQ764DRAFT_234746 [Zygosaccharomyces rouxii]GAV47153.1 hypothetical protein ZYGR_0E01690 [Zygosaccharomyces rouxii]CAR26185.1 ZYRO0B03740p [Zygosaccharomyces rouxii]
MAYGAVMMDSFKGNQADDEKSTSTANATGSDLTPAGRPVIEIATYADTDVYECYIRGYESRIVMRRTQDDWVNITQVFKIAQFSKTQRTKVLEKESNDMRHEKVQGGYGRFQGTWIPLEDAKYMVTKYNIRDPVVTTILAFQLNPNNPPMKRSKNSVLKRTSPDGRITSPSSYNKTPKKRNAIGGSTARKSKKNSMLLQGANPSPLQNLVFQTPQQSHMASQLATNAETTVSATSQANQMSSTKENVIPHLNTEETPLALGYSATQKPLQFYPVPTSLTHPHKMREFTNTTNDTSSFDTSTDMDKSHSQNFLTFIPEGPSSGVFSSQQHQQRVPSILVNGNGNAKKASKRKRKSEDDSIEMMSHDDDSSFASGPPQSSVPPPPQSLPGATPGSTVNGSAGKHLKHKLKNRPSLTAKRTSMAQDKAQQNFKMMQKQLMWQNVRQQQKNSSMPFKMHQNGNISSNANHSSSMDMFSTGENPTPLSSRSSTPNTFAGLPTAPATAHGNENNTDNLGPTLNVEEYKEMILQVLSSEDGSDKDYQLPPQMYHPPSNFDINFEIDDQGHTPLHWATAMANVPLIKLLIALNANALQCNLRGFNCITKSAFYNNCYKADTFSEIVSILRICLITPDNNGRLPLHYLVELSVNKSKDPVVINFYLDTIIHNLGQEDYTLLRMCLNFQDNMGNTVLHLAALNLNLELCNKLCYLGSSMDITNCDNETPASILAKFNLVPAPNPNAGTFLPSAAPAPAPAPTSQGFSQSLEQPNGNSVAATPRPGSQNPSTSVLPEEGQPAANTQQQHKLVPEILPSVEEEDADDNDADDADDADDDDDNEKNEQPVKLTPSISNKKSDVRNFLPGPDSTSLSTLMDDLSNMNSFVTSSAVRDLRTTPSRLLECSPITRKKKNEASAATVSSNLRKTTLADAIQSPLAPIIASPGTMVQEEKEVNNVVKLAGKLGEMSNALKISINTKVNSVANEIENATEGIKCIKQNVNNITRHEKDLLVQFNDGEGVGSVEQMEGSRNQLREYVRDGRQVFVQCLEKSQALNLATLVQEEESKVDADPGSSPAKEGADDTSLKLAAELALLQFKRRLRIQKVTDARTKVDSNNKISKYRRLIGMTIENIDTKLDDIEGYLKTNS